VDDEAGVVLHADGGALLLPGPEIRILLNSILPLLDGSRSAADIVGKAPGALQSSIAELLKVLKRHGVVIAESEKAPPTVDARWAGQDRFFELMHRHPKKMRKCLAESGIAVAGLEPWTATAALELAGAGIGRLHLMDNYLVTQSDLHSNSSLRSRDIGRSRAEVLAEIVTDRAPWCDIRTGDLGGISEPNCDDTRDLVIVGVPPEDLGAQLAVANATYGAGRPSLWSSVAGLEAFVGPLVVPGVGACWNCCRLRLVANAPYPAGAELFQRRLLTQRLRNPSRGMLSPFAGLLGHFLALESLKIVTSYAPSRLVSRVMIQHLGTLDTSLHAICRLPQCEVCGGAGQPDTREKSNALTTAMEPAEIFELFEGWLDSRTGIVSAVGLRDDGPRSSSRACYARSVVCASTAATYCPPRLESTGGKGATPSEAIIGALGEAVERYSASIVPRAALRFAERGRLDGDVLDPRSLCLYADDQYDRLHFPYCRFAVDRPHAWVGGSWLDTGGRVWVPALPAFYRFPAELDEPYCQVTSSGLAAGRDIDDAAVRATLELVERDAFMTTWLLRRSGRRIATESVSDTTSSDVLDDMETCGVRIELYVIESICDIPTVLCIGFGDGNRWPGAHVGIAAHFDPALAARKAILEQAYSGRHIGTRLLGGDCPRPLAPHQLMDFQDHASFYIPPERSSAFEFLRVSGQTPVSIDAIKAFPYTRSRQLGRQLAETGVRVAIVDLTAPDVRHSPFDVVRALGTDLQPLYCGFGLERLSRARVLSEGGPLNTEPHPLC
jgi:ribosomal protein S12 methylthiotransferase accessory factor